MSKNSVTILQNTQGLLNVTGEPARADGWYGYSDGLHTIAVYMNEFQGRIMLQGSISSQPTEEDWFPVLIESQRYLQFPLDPMLPTGTLGDTGTLGFNIKGNFTWLRIKVDRSHIVPQPTTPDQIEALGFVDRVLLNN